jgi:hypothetical protein
MRSEPKPGKKFLLICLHGLVFSVIMTIMTIAWAFLFAFLVVIGFIIGLIVGFVVLIFVFGWVNTFVAEFIWDFDLESDWKTLGIHGLELFLILLVVGIPSLIASALFPSILTAVVMFIVYIPIDGYVAHAIARQFDNPSSTFVSYQ